MSRSLFYNYRNQDKKIRIINEENDIDKDYSFSELIEFSKLIIELKKTYLKKNFSNVDLFGSNTVGNNSNNNLLSLSSPPQGADSINIDPLPHHNILNSSNSNNNNAILISHQSKNSITSSTTITITNTLINDSTSSSNSDTNSQFSPRISQILSPPTYTTGSLVPNLSHNQLLSPGGTSNIRQVPFLDRIISSDKSYWMDLEGINQDELSVLCKLFSVHPLTIEDMISCESTEKCEEHSTYTFISTSEVSYSTAGDLVQIPVFMLLFSGLIITIHPCNLICFPSVIKAFMQHLDVGEPLPSTDWVVALFFEAFTEIYSEHMHQLVNEVRVLEDFTLREEVVHQELYMRLGKATRKSTNLLSYIFIKNDILSNLLRVVQSKETKILFISIKDQTLRVKQRLKLIEELLENISTVYISKISLILNEEAHSLNMSMRTFTALTVIFLPLTFIAGVFGMNVLLPGGENETYGMFIGIVLAMTIIGLGLFAYFRKLDWL